VIAALALRMIFFRAERRRRARCVEADRRPLSIRSLLGLNQVRNRASIAVQLERRERRSRNELVPTGFSDQDLWHRCIFFNFLAQSINMRLQCVRRHARIVSPDLLQQNFA
jgi:hypothetical protein